MEQDDVSRQISQCRDLIRQTREAVERDRVMGEALNGPIAALASLAAEVEELKRLLTNREKAPA